METVGLDPQVANKCREVRAHRVDSKIMWAALTALTCLYTLKLITSGGLLAAGVWVFFTVNLAVAASRLLREKIPSLWPTYSRKAQSWGFLAMVTLLPVLAALDAAGYQKVSVRFFHSDAWWIIVALIVGLYAVVYRLVFELAASTDYLKFNSYWKVAQDFYCVPVTFLAVVLAFPVVFFTPWGVAGTLLHVGMLLLIAVWIALGAYIDRLREQWGSASDWRRRYRLDRSGLHIQGDELGEEVIPYWPNVPSPLHLAGWYPRWLKQRLGPGPQSTSQPAE